MRVRCLLMKLGLEMSEHHDLHTHLNRTRVFTGSPERMSVRTVGGR